MDYTIGDNWFVGQYIDVTVRKDGYDAYFMNVSELISEEKRINDLHLISEEEAVGVCCESLMDRLVSQELEQSQEDMICQKVYLMIDKGRTVDENVYDIGYYIKIPVTFPDGNIPYYLMGIADADSNFYIEGLVDGEYPYCYTASLITDTANLDAGNTGGGV